MPVQGSSPYGFQRAAAWVRDALGKQVPVAAVLLIAVLLLVPQVLPGVAQRLLPRPDAVVEGIELKDFIVKVKADLAAAEAEGRRKGERPLLELQDVELVVNFVVQSKAEADVKLVTVNGSALSGLERSQKITLKLKPVPPEQVEVPAQSAPIPPGAMRGEVAPPGERSP